MSIERTNELRKQSQKKSVRFRARFSLIVVQVQSDSSKRSAVIGPVAKPMREMNHVRVYHFVTSQLRLLFYHSASHVTIFLCPKQNKTGAKRRSYELIKVSALSEGCLISSGGQVLSSRAFCLSTERRVRAVVRTSKYPYKEVTKTTGSCIVTSRFVIVVLSLSKSRDPNNFRSLTYHYHILTNASSLSVLPLKPNALRHRYRLSRKCSRCIFLTLVSHYFSCYYYYCC